MANEQTPLIQVVRVQPHRERYTHSTSRRFCTIVLSSVVVAAIILFLLAFGWQDDNHYHGKPPHYPWTNATEKANSIKPKGLSYKDLQEILLKTPQEAKAEEWSKYYTSGPHLAGKNLSQAEWTKERWQEFGVGQTEVVAYDIYINYPLGHRLALLEASTDDAALTVQDMNDSGSKYNVKHEFNLEEDILDEDETSGLDNRVPTFHGYSASGNVTAPYVYVNFGTHEDFEDLLKANVTLKGKIAVAKYGQIFRGLKVKRAQELGMVGVVLYTDPQEDGEIVEENGYKPYPEGPARNPSAVQRGSVQFLSMQPGDPTTPGYPSLPGAPRVDPSFSTPSIPSLPISYAEAIPLLKALNGYGPKASDFNEYWQGGKLANKGVEYNIGPSPPELVLHLVNEQEYVTTPLWNVIGIINGTIEDEVIVMGNHRDASIAGGEAEPNSGAASLNEVIRSFGEALKAGWKPLRTIVFASWDGEEYGLLGSTEWVEQYVPWLSKAAVAYINCDVSVRGSNFQASASPGLFQSIYEISSLVQSPNQTTKGSSVRDLWDGRIHAMGSGSDFTAFLDFAGIPSLDMGFGGSPNDPVYHYHSNYDSFHWMSKYGDKGFKYHVTATKLLSLLAAQLIETPILAMNTTDYAKELSVYVQRVKDHAKDKASSIVSEDSSLFANIQVAISHLLEASQDFDKHAQWVANQLAHERPWWKWWQKRHLYRLARRVNTKYKYFERQFLYEQGLDSRPWFKHVIFAPGKWTGYSGSQFPGLVEALDDGDRTALERWSLIIQGNIEAATKLLRGD